VVFDVGQFVFEALVVNDRPDFRWLHSDAFRRAPEASTRAFFRDLSAVFG
jgi:hypothetical protein